VDDAEWLELPDDYIAGHARNRVSNRVDQPDGRYGETGLDELDGALAGLADIFRDSGVDLKGDVSERARGRAGISARKKLTHKSEVGSQLDGHEVAVDALDSGDAALQVPLGNDNAVAGSQT